MFSRFAFWVAKATGHPVTFSAALAIVVLWGISGPYFNYSDTWQLAINTGTTIITFLMVFVIQHAQDAAGERDRQTLELLREHTAQNQLVLTSIAKLLERIEKQEQAELLMLKKKKP